MKYSTKVNGYVSYYDTGFVSWVLMVCVKTIYECCLVGLAMCGVYSCDITLSMKYRSIKCIILL